MESHLCELKKQFHDLLYAVEDELQLKHNAMAVIEREGRYPEPILNEHHNYILLCIQGARFFPSLAIFFKHLRLHSWNYFEHEMLRFFIEKQCSENLNSKMSQYAERVENFKKHTTIGDLISIDSQLSTLKGVPYHFKNVITEHSVEANKCTLAEIETFRKDLHTMLRIQLSQCVLQMHSIKLENTENRIIVQWIFPEELRHKFIYADYRQLMHSHQVETLSIDGKSSYSVTQQN